MSLPKLYENPAAYFKDCTNFFKKYQFLYNFANTELLLHNVLDKITVNFENTDVFNANFDLRDVKDVFLDEFFEELKTFEVFYDDFVEDCNLEEKFDVPLRPKKRHEIIYLAREIKKIYEGRCDLVVDFGSGLGYLDQFIFEMTKFKVLGLECSESNYVGAKKRQRKYHETSIEDVKYIKHTIHSESHIKIKEFLMDKFPNCTNFGITGLHACADLTIDAINIFLRMEAAKHLVIMPCCYHKMVQNDGKFENFPLSSTLKTVFNESNGSEFLKIPFLRLGAQPPEVMDTLENSVFNLMARAVLQLYAHKHNYKLKRTKRKAVKTKSTSNNFENYIQEASKGFMLSEKEPKTNENTVHIEFDLDELKETWHKIDDLTFKKARIFILLQNYLQPVVENYILFDRLVYLRENGVKCCFKKILNEKLSPRCLVLIASK